jgi:hypothetical protein
MRSSISLDELVHIPIFQPYAYIDAQQARELYRRLRNMKFSIDSIERGNGDMRVAEVPLFTYEELSDVAKREARKWYKNMISNDSSVYTQQITEMFSEKLNELGYPTDDIRWSLSHKDDDGVAFYGSVDGWKVCKIARRLLSPRNAHFIKWLNLLGADLKILIERNIYSRRINNSKTMRVEIISMGGLYRASTDLRRVYSLLADFQKAIENEIRQVSKQLEELGYREIEEQFNDDRIAESITTKGFKFTEDGMFWSAI